MHLVKTAKKFFLQAFVSVTVAGKGFVPLFVAVERDDKIEIHNILVKI